MSNFVLRVGGQPAGANLDFRGPSRWGHNLHASTWKVVGPPPRAWWDLLGRRLDRREKARRSSFLCHVQGEVRVGQSVLWTGGRGDMEGIVVEVKPMGDPDDMYKLVVEVRGDGRHQPRPPEHINCRSVLKEPS